MFIFLFLIIDNVYRIYRIFCSPFQRGMPESDV